MAQALAESPYLADRRTDAQITLRVDPDDHPLVWADNGDVIIALGDPGAGVAGVRAHVSSCRAPPPAGGSPTSSASSTTR